jgi:hypothetical protein
MSKVEKALLFVGVISFASIQIENFDKPYYWAIALTSAFVAITATMAIRRGNN